MNLTYTLLADGNSDRSLLHIINWALEQIPGMRVNSQFADVSLKHRVGLYRRAEAAVNVYECDILFVHRDAETVALDDRIDEINDNLNELDKPYVPIVPIRMTEAWLLIDELAIRTAASNPNGHSDLDMPRVDRLEGIPNPKHLLDEKLKLASDLPASRLRKFRPESRRHRVAELITDYSPLRRLSAFRQFENDLIACVHTLS
jgi:hypothetical protein